MQAQMRRWGAGNHMHARVSIPISLCLLSVVWSPGQEAEQKVENGGLSSHLDILFLFSFFSPLCVVLLHRSCTINGAPHIFSRSAPPPRLGRAAHSPLLATTTEPLSNHASAPFSSCSQVSFAPQPCTSLCLRCLSVPGRILSISRFSTSETRWLDDRRLCHWIRET